VLRKLQPKYIANAHAYHKPNILTTDCSTHSIPIDLTNEESNNVTDNISNIFHPDHFPDLFTNNCTNQKTNKYSHSLSNKCADERITHHRSFGITHHLDAFNVSHTQPFFFCPNVLADCVTFLICTHNESVGLSDRFVTFDSSHYVSNYLATNKLPNRKPHNVCSKQWSVSFSIILGPNNVANEPSEHNSNNVPPQKLSRIIR